MNYDTNPTESGWYPVAICWDENEGCFGEASYWNGKAWDTANPVVGFGDKCETKAGAERLANEIQ